MGSTAPRDRTAPKTRPVAFARLLLGIGILAVLTSLAVPTPAEAAQRHSGLFGTREVRAKNLKPFPKWTGMLERYFDERALSSGPCESIQFNRCHLAEWKRILADLENKDRMTQIRGVNRYMNERRYIVDPVNWGVRDYWATPGQFFDKRGDCEDYAITKSMALRALGFTNDSLRIVVLKDLNLRVAHAVLVVYLDGVAYVLDNQVKRVVRAEHIRHYKPYYSINEEHWWLHRG